MESQKWIEAKSAPPPPELMEKLFEPKCGIPVLEDYEQEKFPGEYWDCWPVRSLEHAQVETWVDFKELQELCEDVGINVKHGTPKTVLGDLEHGADIGARGRSRLGSKGPNSKLALQYASKVQDTICAFVNKGFYIGPLTWEEASVLGDLKVHPVTARLKPDGSVRVITDASFPYDVTDEEESTEAASLNRFINIDLYPVKMDGLQAFLEQLEEEGKGAFIAKEDLSDAYKHIPVRKEDWRLQAIAWGDRVFIDTRLMFGTGSSAGIFDRFDGLLLEIAIKLSKFSKRRAKRFLDDVFALEGRLGQQLQSLNLEGSSTGGYLSKIL